MLKKNEQVFTLKIYDESETGFSKIELPTQLVIKICKEMRILKQMWFNFNANETDIIKSKDRILVIDRCYNITQKDFLLLINVVKNNNSLSDLIMGDVKALRNLLNTLGGNPKLENCLDEIRKKQKYDFTSSKEERYFKTTIRPELDYHDKFEWRQAGIMHLCTMKKYNDEGYTLVSQKDNIYCFRKRK